MKRARNSWEKVVGRDLEVQETPEAWAEHLPCQAGTIHSLSQEWTDVLVVANISKSYLVYNGDQPANRWQLSDPAQFVLHRGMSEELLDEVTSINSIYGDATLLTPSEGSSGYILLLPSQLGVTLRIEFPPDYPDAPPSILGTEHVGETIAKGEAHQIVDAVRLVLAEIYVPGSPCIFDLIEESGQRLQQLGLDQSLRDEAQKATQANGQITSSEIGDVQGTQSDEPQSVDGLDDPPPWIISGVISEKKSVFVARAAEVHSVDEAKHYLAHLLATDKKVAKATHNITAWRICREDGVRFQDCDDDGETAAGSRVLHLLELMGVRNAMVIVTRWYGGVQLGPDRFRIINQTARDAVVKGGFAPDAQAKEKEGSKKKGKR